MLLVSPARVPADQRHAATHHRHVEPCVDRWRPRHGCLAEKRQVRACAREHRSRDKGRAYLPVREDGSLEAKLTLENIVLELCVFTRVGWNESVRGRVSP